MEKPIIEIGLDKDGDFDFSISATIQELGLVGMNELRAMITVAIGTAEDMWRRGQQKKYPATGIDTDLSPNKLNR